MSFFSKSLQDVVKGIRANKRDPKAYISSVIADCKKELRDADPFVKSNAIRKLTYLLMMGYDMSWADFHVVEVMSQARFAHKRIGYLAASQSFQRDTEVVLLTTNLLKKEFGSMNIYDIGQAINCMVNIVNKDLARDLLPDTVTLMAHSKPYVRKKAVLAMYKLFVAYPQGLRLTFDKLKDKLNDAEASVVSCAVNVICELANKNPKNYLSMAPQFFRLLTTSSNNWMLIKVVKLLGSLVPEEPRLARKLLEPLSTIIQNTAAKSLQYECIYTVTLALPYTKKQDGSESKNVPQVVRLCSDILKQFVENDDQNLKYLGLVGFVQLMRSHPKAVVEHRDLVLLCLSDLDETIRLRALELLTGMVTKRNLEELIHKLLRYVMVAEGSYRDELISKIVFMCSRDKFAYLTDFAWYLSVLVDLATIQGSAHGKLVALQLMDVTVRVAPIRGFAVESLLGLLLDQRLVEGPGRKTLFEVLYAAAWVVGEYASLIPSVAKGAWKRASDNGVDLALGDEEMAALTGEALAVSEVENLASDLISTRGPDTVEGEEGAVKQQQGRGGLRFPRRRPFLCALKALLDPRATNLPPHVQSVYMQNALKVFVAGAQPGACLDDEVAGMALVCSKRLVVFLQSNFVEVQERANALQQMLITLGAIVPAEAIEVKLKGKGGNANESGELNDDEGDSVLSAMPDIPLPSDDDGSGGCNGGMLGDLLGTGSADTSSTAAAAAAPLVVVDGGLASLVVATDDSLLGVGNGVGNGDGALQLASPGDAVADHWAASPPDGGGTAANAAATPEALAAVKAKEEAAVKAIAASRAGAPLLAALLREVMTPVNPKAQRRVPLPPGLDLNTPIDSTALNACYDEAEGDLKPTNSLAEVSFTSFQFYSEDKGIMGGFGSDDFQPGMEGPGGGESGSGGWLGLGEEDKQGAMQDKMALSGGGLGTEGSDAFYLKASNALASAEDVDVDDIPMLSLRPDLDRSGKAKKKGKKGKKGKRGEEYVVNRDDDMPDFGGGGGNNDSDSDGGNNNAGGGKRGKAYRKAKSKSSASGGGGFDMDDDDDDDLANMDLSKPLGQDEVMPERKHRVVDQSAAAERAQADAAAAAAAAASSGGGEGAEGGGAPPMSKEERKQAKKDAKAAEKAAEKEKKHEKKAAKAAKKVNEMELNATPSAPPSGNGGAADGGLLDLFGGGGAGAAAAAAAGSGGGGGESMMMGGGGGEVAAAAAVAGDKKKSKKDKKSSSSDKKEKKKKSDKKGDKGSGGGDLLDLM